MLYNQALLTHNFLDAYQITNKTTYRIAAEEVLDFVSREMTDTKGGFYSAIDAETDAEEGAYYTWTEQDIRQILKKDADFFLSCYALEPLPEGSTGVIYKTDTDSAISGRHQIDATTLQARLSPLKEKLLNTRSQRIRPLLDDKIITAWNGLMIGAYARAYRVLDRTDYLVAAQKAADFIDNNLRNADDNLYRIYREGQRKGEAYQEDYAFLIDGLLHLYRATHSAPLSPGRSIAFRTDAHRILGYDRWRIFSHAESKRNDCAYQEFLRQCPALWQCRCPACFVGTSDIDTESPVCPTRPLAHQ